MATYVDFSGPFFDARLDHAAEELDYDVEHDVAQQAMADWHLNLDRSLRHPTGFYESHLTMRTSPSAAGGTIVTDQGVIYGHWLEGDGSRNSPETRFPGYWSARRATQSVAAKAPDVAVHAVDRFCRRVNGE